MSQDDPPIPNPAPDLPQETTHGKRRPSALWVWLVFFVIVGVIGVALNARGIYRYGRSIYARHRATQSMQYIEAQQWFEAMKALSDANRFDNEDPVVLRATATFLTRTSNDARSLIHTLKRLIAAGKGTPEDHLTLAKAHLSLSEVSEARQLFTALTPGQQKSKDGLELLAQVLRAEGHPAEAEETLRKALLTTPDDPESKLRIALLDYDNTFPEVQNRARDTMWELLQTQNDTALAALTFLSRDKHLSSTDAERLLKAVEAHPGASSGQRLEVLSAIMRISPQRREEVLTAEVERNEGKSTAELIGVAAWLAKEKQHTRILQLIPPQIAMQSPEVFPYVAQALTEEGRWADLKRMLTGGDKLPVPPARVQVWLAQAAINLNPGDRSTPRQHLDNASEIAGRTNDLSSLAAAAQIAEEQGLYDLAIRSYERLANANPKFEIEVFGKIFELALRTRDTSRLLEVSAKLHELRPSSGIFRDRLHYLGLLTGMQMEISLDAIASRDGEAMIEGQTTRIPTSFLRALAAYRFRDNDTLQSSLTDLTGQFDRLSPGQRAVVAGLLRYCGREVEAFRLKESVSKTLLLAEERVLLGQNW